MWVSVSFTSNLNKKIDQHKVTVTENYWKKSHSQKKFSNQTFFGHFQSLCRRSFWQFWAVFLNIQKCGKIDVCSFDKMRNEYIFCNLSPNIISWLEHYSYHDVGNFNGASCWVLLQKRKAAPTFSLQSSMHEAITGIFTTRHDLHRHIFQLAVASKMTYCMASFTPWNTRVATTAFFQKREFYFTTILQSYKSPFQTFRTLLYN